MLLDAEADPDVKAGKYRGSVLQLASIFAGPSFIERLVSLGANEEAFQCVNLSDEIYHMRSASSYHSF